MQFSLLIKTRTETFWQRWFCLVVSGDSTV